LFLLKNQSGETTVGGGQGPGKQLAGPGAFFPNGRGSNFPGWLGLEGAGRK